MADVTDLATLYVTKLERLGQIKNKSSPPYTRASLSFASCGRVKLSDDPLDMADVTDLGFCLGNNVGDAIG